MPHIPSLPNPAHLSDFFKLFPDNTAPLMAYTDGILRSKGELSIGERELIATFVSGLNACAFCHDSHKVYAEAYGIDADLIAALVADVETAPVSEKLRPLLRYVAKLNSLPSKIVQADSDAVYAAGWSEQAMYEAISVCALFNMMNRLIEGAGLNFDYIANPEVHPAHEGYSPKLERSYRAFGERLEAEGKDGSEPKDADARRAVKPVICYPRETLPTPDMGLYHAARKGAVKLYEVVVAPREAACFRVDAGQFFRISCMDGPQVGDLNLWNANDLDERFYSGKTRALHGTHLTTGERMWSSFPQLRPMATIITDTLEWYGIDPFGGSVHDVIGTRCDPYTHNLLTGGQYHHCCHSNLTRALADEIGGTLAEAERHVHDVLNVFMCTGFTRDTGQYFMKSSPVRVGDYLEFFAEINLLGALSACPGGDCSAEHSSDGAACYPLLVEVFEPVAGALDGWQPPARNRYAGGHGA